MYDYNREAHRLIVRMPTRIHEIFFDGSSLKAILSGSGRAACFALKVSPARSAEIYFPVENASFHTKSKCELNAFVGTMTHDVLISLLKLHTSKKKTRLNRLTGNYLMDIKYE